MTYEKKVDVLDRLEHSRSACLILYRLMALNETFVNTLLLKDLEFIIEHLTECMDIIRNT